MSYKVELIAHGVKRDYLRGLTEQEAVFICQKHDWYFLDENGFEWDMDYTEEKGVISNE